LISINAKAPAIHTFRGMDSKLCQYAAKPVPRYTSYPTAPHFTDTVDSAEYAGWLKRVDRDTPTSLYLHIPYCRSICHYCGCHTKATRQEAPVHAYAATLGRELALVRRHLGKGHRLRHIHWGGGTPSLLPQADFEALIAEIRAMFEIEPDAEHAMELDPRTVTAELAQSLFRAGITRVSLGVQDLNPQVQEAIGRVQPFAVVERAVTHLRDAGIEQICFDLMYGLPHQGDAEIARTIHLAATLQPTRIALFGYAHVPWMKKHQRLIDEDALPDTVARLAQSEEAALLLATHGYRRVGLDHFVLPNDSLARAAADGTLRRNFQGYTADSADTLIAIGTSAIGYLPQGFIQNETDIRRWRHEIELGRLPVLKGKRVSTDDLLRAEIIERLMCRFEVDLQAACAHYGVDPMTLENSKAALAPLQHDGLVEIDGDRLKVPPAQRPFVRLVAAAFDAYLPSGAAKHSAAV